MRKTAFTLAEVLITLAIIGVVAAMAIPSVISNAQQQEFKTGLRKAVSVLNSAITMNIALDGESPYDNGDLFHYLQKHMSVMKSTTFLPFASRDVLDNTDRTSTFYAGNELRNAAFYTTDGVRFEFYGAWGYGGFEKGGQRLHESDAGLNHVTMWYRGDKPTMRCGSYGLSNNSNNTTAIPCLIAIDVNGDRKPYPSNVNAQIVHDNLKIIPLPNSKKIRDCFAIMITEDRAVPFGVLAQKAMYQAQK